MKLLIFSDSHSSLRAMRAYVRAVAPDALVHLGDYYGDGSVIAQENPALPTYQVAGNCDRWRCTGFEPEQLVCRLGGAVVFMAHGHRYSVKSGTGSLLAAARERGTQLVLYGHTHTPDCRREADGLWVVNPGSCGFGGTAACVTLEGGAVMDCRILYDTENAL